MALGPRLQQFWFRKSLLSRGGRPAALADTLLFNLLTPVSWLFRGAVALRRLAFRRGWLGAARLPVPVVVVGNIIVGGAGKTPLTLYLAQQLRAAGRHPGIVSRGYGGAQEGVAAVPPGATPAQVGDEPLLLARESGCPVWIGRDRAAAARALLAAQPECDVILCDDGLQHYRLARDVEIAVCDVRGLGNGRLLPVGPLREPRQRLAEVDAVVGNGMAAELLFPAPASQPPLFRMTLVPTRFLNLHDPEQGCSVEALQGKKLYAVAGIGHPQRFFRTLADLGLSVETRAFPDHHAYTAADLEFARDGVLLTTAKDGVKCAAIYGGEAWVLPVAARLTPDLSAFVLEKINGRTAAGHPGLPGVQG
ncbi:MAG TPA: tetraacyldisaccharide 4'-kinase [Azospira sp.]|nr:tetraacyldisaccharide 4'-kinase [Azospira sp.]